MKIRPVGNSSNQEKVGGKDRAILGINCCPEQEPDSQIHQQCSPPRRSSARGLKDKLGVKKCEGEEKIGAIKSSLKRETKSLYEKYLTVRGQRKSSITEKEERNMEET